MRRSLLILGLLSTVACTTVRVAPPPPAAEISGRWVGTWRTIDQMNLAREGQLDVDFAQDGARGRGRMVWTGTWLTDLPPSAKDAGAMGVPVVFVVAGSAVVVRHEAGAHDFAVQLAVEGDEMTGVVETPARAELRLTRQSRPGAPTTTERVGLLETDMVRAKEQLGGLDTRLTSLGTTVDGVRGTAEEAASAAREAVSTAGDSRTAATETAARVDRALAHGTNGHNGGRALVHTVDVRFGFDRWQLDDRTATALGEIVQLLKENPEITAELEGYTDSVGTQNYNLQLSQRRVEAVHRYLARRGIPLERIHVVGLGQLPEADATARTKNRRVTVKLLITD